MIAQGPHSRLVPIEYSFVIPNELGETLDALLIEGTRQFGDGLQRLGNRNGKPLREQPRYLVGSDVSLYIGMGAVHRTWLVPAIYK